VLVEKCLQWPSVLAVACFAVVEGYFYDRGVGGTNWFNMKIVRNVGYGMDASIGNDFWVVITGPLCPTFPRFFFISNKKEAKVGEV